MNNPAELPCHHTWLWVDNDETVDYAYFECIHCYEQREYDPADLADVEQETGDED